MNADKISIHRWINIGADDTGFVRCGVYLRPEKNHRFGMALLQRFLGVGAAGKDVCLAEEACRETGFKFDGKCNDNVSASCYDEKNKK